jgi:hypothetical protein
MLEWAVENRGLKGNEGSTFIEVDDPEAPGGKRYVARRNSVVGSDPLLGDRPTMGPGRRIMQRENPVTGEQEDFVTQDKAPSLSPSQIRSWKVPFEQDMAKREYENERLRRKAEAEEARKEAMQAEIEKARAMGGIALEQEKARRTLEQEMPNPMDKLKLDEFKLQAGDRGFAREDAANKRTRDTKRADMLRDGGDIPGLSENAERAAADALATGAPLEDAEAMGRRAHQEDIAEIRRLEESGQPDRIAAAAKMRLDPDLRSVRSFIPERNTMLERSVAQEALSGPLESLYKRGDKEGFWGLDEYEDLDQSERGRLSVGISDAVSEVRRLAPQMDTQSLRSVVEQRMRTRGFPDDYVQAVLALVQ